MLIMKRILRISVAEGMFSLLLFAAAAWAGEPVDCLLCQSGTMNVVVSSDELTVMSSENRGIVIDNTSGKFFDNNTIHNIGLLKIEKGKLTGTLIGKHMDPNGDYYVVETTIAGAEMNWKFLYGTGKFKGLTGSGKSLRLTKGKPISPGTAQSCSRVTGSYELGN